MTDWPLFVALAVALISYAFWVYLRVELRVRGAVRLALLRAAALLLMLLLLFDPALPRGTGAARDWVLLDASLSMAARGADRGATAWDQASARAEALERAGWRVVTFGEESGREGGAEMGPAEASGGAAVAEGARTDEPEELRTLLAPALERAAEAGADRVRVLSDFRLEDAVAVRAALGSLPVQVELERFGDAAVNAGVSALDVPDLARPDGSVTAEVEVHGGREGEPMRVELFEEGRLVASADVPAPGPGLRARAEVELPTPVRGGRLRYTARVSLGEGSTAPAARVGSTAARDSSPAAADSAPEAEPGASDTTAEPGPAGTPDALDARPEGSDAFPSDDEAVTYANVGHEEGALVLVSFRPDWEPRYLLPVLADVTGLSAVGYLRAGADRFVDLAPAVDRRGPVDSVAVRAAAMDAALLVLHGVQGALDPWARSLVSRPGRRLIFLGDADAAALVGLRTGPARIGEWYVSPDLPPSPVAGELAGQSFRDLPPLTDVLVPVGTESLRPPFLVQLRGSGRGEAPLHLSDDGPRSALVLASGFWRWAARPDDREVYRSLWSGVAGWLLADETVVSAEVRPSDWVVERGQPVAWNVPEADAGSRLVVRQGDSTMVDTLVSSAGRFVSGTLPPGTYDYRVEDGEGGQRASGRFDVARATAEMLPEPAVPEVPEGTLGAGVELGQGRPLRTLPWPYLLIILLLCAEWIGRRRSGLR